MLRTSGLALLALVSAVGPSQASGFTEKGLSLLGYQLCSHRVTHTVQKVEAVQTSYTSYVSCGGWIPWRRCPKMVYRTQYLVVEVPESRNMTDCCEGYEQLGLYCVLPLNQSRQFTSRPGVCPAEGPEPSTSPCSLDTDCPGLEKCCPWSGGRCCMAPAPQAPERDPVGSWYNVTILVKMDFKELQQVDPRLLNHMRLLHSLVTSALQPMASTVHHLHSAPGDASTTVSRLLLGLPRPLPVANVSTLLGAIAKRVYEVISVQVQDVNECFYEELNACSGRELCANLEGSYRCVCHQEAPATSPRKLNLEWEDCPPVSDYVVLNVTSDSFQVSWRLNSTQNHTFHVRVYRGMELLRSARTQSQALAVAGLEAGVLYRVKTSYQGCGADVSTTLTVKTNAQVFEVTIKIVNHNLTEKLLNRSSVEYQDFSRQLLHEVESSFPPAVSDLYRSGKLRMQIVSLQAGSVVVRLKLTVQDPGFPMGISTLAPLLQPLLASTVFQIDWQGTRVQDWDECVDSAEHDCSPAAWCINLEGSYTCQCRTTRDATPSRAGRACEVPVSIGRIMVSNVTSTGFHLAWEADLAMDSTFQLTLTSTWSPAVVLETWNTSVTLSGLEPGVLHLVEIMAKACGKEGARAHLKVRTAARKLIGKVRIKNVRYSESFRNASSQECRDFLELFFRTVRGSLPATMCQHMDAGGVRMEVIGVTNGSVVVEFHLLIIADVDVQEVSAAFLTAFQTAPLLEVIRGDTFIQDYDECERKEDDCVPGTSCRNTLGSFTCSCEGGAPDFPVEYSERPCEGDSPGNETWATSPERPLTTAGTKAAFVQGTSPTPQGLPQRLNLTAAVRVLCEIEKVVVAIQKRFLQQESIPESSLYLSHPSCNVSHSNGTHVLLEAGWNECGTLMQSNMTNTVVRTTLRNDLSQEGIIHHLKILSPIYCAFQNDLLTSSGFTLEWGVYAIIEDLHGAGNFVTEMQLFIGDSPIPQNYSVSASDDVRIEVGLYRQKSNLKVVLTECWATPSSNARDPVTFSFINNSCPVPNTYTNMIENGNSNKAQFKLRVFSFINNSIVYLHCKLRICMESPGATCKINCNNFRLLQNSETSATHQMSWGPLIRSEGEPPHAEAGLGAGYVVLIVVAIFVLVAGTATLLIMRYQRMNGRYNFKIQSNNFSYQVFYE
ncbi:UMODL1 isoform 5 [Pan troglodytes]|uniref:UMODL1 isoform 5 n=1 Tax=Pan troglodytes TaxID=9598 RepID=A0A2J8M878_PANTR|nr:UMODL1 isoform 5 [Pan troglodytes]